MITHSGNKILINGKTLELEYPAINAFRIDDIIVVLFDPESYTKKYGQFHNLIAIAPSGKVLWKAELPTTTSGDRYYKIVSQKPLISLSVYSMKCEIDSATGRISARSFFK